MPKPAHAVIRSFITIDLSDELKQRLDQVSSRFRKAFNDLPVRWVATRNIHLTLKFFGDVPQDGIPEIRTMLQRIAGNHPRFPIGLSGWGVFPRPEKPRVIWIGVSAPPTLVDLQHAIENGAESLGYSHENRAFSPHLTLGRVSWDASNAERQAIAALLGTFQVEPLGVMSVGQVCLFRSELKPNGAVYTRLFAAGLAQPSSDE